MSAFPLEFLRNPTLRAFTQWRAQPQWVVPAASFDIDFINQRAWIENVRGQGVAYDLAGMLGQLTFTRASSATYFDSAGLLQTAANDVMRFDHDPVTLAPRGILVEAEARTNLITYSDDFANASWTKTGATISSDAITAPDAGGADKIAEDTSTGEHGVLGSNVSYTSGTTYCLSAIVKAAERTLIRALLPATAFGVNCAVVFNLSAGTAALVTGSASTVYSITAFGGGWWRITLSAAATATVSATSAQFRLVTTGTTASYTGTLGHGLYLWGAQLEAGASASSLIRTAGASTTRAADTLTFAIGDWFSHDAGAWLVQFETDYALASGARALCIDDGTTQNRHMLSIRNGSGQFGANTDVTGSAQANISLGATASGIHKIAYGYAANSFAASLDGATAVMDTSGSLPAGLTTGRFGRESGSSGRGLLWIRRAAYVPGLKGAAYIEALSA